MTSANQGICFTSHYSFSQEYQVVRPPCSRNSEPSSLRKDSQSFRPFRSSSMQSMASLTSHRGDSAGNKGILPPGRPPGSQPSSHTCYPVLAIYPHCSHQATYNDRATSKTRRYSSRTTVSSPRTRGLRHVPHCSTYAISLNVLMSAG